MRLGAVIAAAGIPGGFRAYEKLRHTDADSMIRRMIGTFRRAGVDDIAVITGYQAEETEKSLAKLGVVFLRRENYEQEQMMDFALTGFQYLRQKCRRLFFCPADVPLFDEKTVREMAAQDAPVVIPVYEGRKGHPVLIDASLIDGIAEYRGDRGLKGALDESGAEIVLLPVEDEGVLVRARKEDRFEEDAVNDMPLRVYPRVKVQLVKNTAFFGPGMMVLLKQIKLLGNVREACEKTGMSYSKGRALIRTAEEEAGCRIVLRSPGGKTGGTARVSPEGRILMERYERLEREVAEFAMGRYQEIFEERN